MKMKSMKMAKSDAVPVAESGKGPHYPWGLRINLDEAAMKKLGMPGMPEAGDECMIHAKGKVVRVSQSADKKRNDRSMEVQITSMSMDGEAMDRRTLRAMNLDPDDPKVRRVYKQEKRSMNHG